MLLSRRDRRPTPVLSRIGIGTLPVIRLGRSSSPSANGSPYGESGFVARPPNRSIFPASAGKTSPPRKLPSAVCIKAHRFGG
jgi:hypothetical protein